MTAIQGAVPTMHGARTGNAHADLVLLDGTALSIEDVVRIADRRVAVGVAPAGLDRLHQRRLTAPEAVTRPVYGRTTGVGANRSEAVPGRPAHGMRLLRSHASGIGNVLPERDVRAMLAVRVNQVLCSGSGLQPAIAEAIVRALNAGAYPEVHEHGAVGTGDLGPLAELGLALAGEVRWAGTGPAPDPVVLADGDALALISSNALTIAQAALAVGAVRGLLHATVPVAALTLLAVDGSTEPFAPEVHAAHPHIGASWVTEEMLTWFGGRVACGHRVQDPFGLRCFPQVHGPALEAVADAESVLAVELNTAGENPLITAGTVRHHGGFHAARLALALDRLRLAMLSTAQLSAGRLSMLAEPEMTGLRSFLASGPPGSSGIMMLEYGVGSALAELRAAAFPATLGHIVLSRGAEEHASFASQAAKQIQRAEEAYRLVLACELVAAVRANRLRGASPAQPVRAVYERACRVLDPDVRDRPLSADVAAAAALVDEIAVFGSSASVR
ncbi:aromatic amino acid ammonia-lyase [Saccharopolyspora phatthalungensis]|uniref:Histidine ammonia-lyase n=1 Tax=Saccharopolyspora phatthalungensis TaxID=664693 RepID=A0A840QIQ9_9PSEU|nr:aromatic amino acid ammonia-lyase [Saccharopolyspora phatthalungensis]MBB5158525.1 histidine ammonia-lyase [Saccharopolyspora phatthalungensis]